MFLFLNIPPPQPDEEGAQLVRLRSQQRDGRPTGVVDDLIRQIQARQRSAAPTKQRTTIRREEEETVAGQDEEQNTYSERRRKKRGSGGHNKTQEATAPSHLHLMYRKETSREQGNEERDVSDA